LHQQRLSVISKNTKQFASQREFGYVMSAGVRRGLASFGSVMEAESKPAIVARNASIVPKQKRIERLLSGYAVRELCDDSEGYYWYVVVAFELMVMQNP
jgi:hypothetical protein